MNEPRQEYLPSTYEVKKLGSFKYGVTESWDHYLDAGEILGSGYTRLSVALPGVYRTRWGARRAARRYRNYDFGGC